MSANEVFNSLIRIRHILSIDQVEGSFICYQIIPLSETFNLSMVNGFLLLEKRIKTYFRTLNQTHK